MTTLRLFIHKLLHEQRGAVTVTYLLCFPVILFMLLGSIDFIRYSLAQGKLQNALDAAAISAGRNLEKFTPEVGSDHETRWRADAAGYFHSNMPQGFLGSRIPPESLKIDYATGNTGQGAIGAQLVQMSASGTLPLLTTGMMERTSFNLSVANEAVRRRGDLEMVLALDNTGSMGQGNPKKIDALKAASKNLVASLLQDSRNGDSDVAIGIVPFADTVYVGRDKAHWLSPSAQKSPYIASNINWAGCLVEPYVGDTFAAEPGLPGRFEPLITVATLSAPDNHLITTAQLKARYERQRNGGKAVAEYRIFPAFAPQITGPRSIRADIDSNGNIVPQFAFNPDYIQKNVRHDNCPSSREMLFLTDNKAALEQKIGDMVDDGRTIIPLGLLWSWRMLEPGWRSGWGDGQKPRDKSINLDKAVVLLTDGNNQLDAGVTIDGEKDIAVEYAVHFKYQVRKDGNSAWSEAEDDSYSAYIEKLNDDNHLLSSYKYANSVDFTSLRVGSIAEIRSGGTAIQPYGEKMDNAAMNKLTATLCTRMKQEGIKIYTVVLGDSVSEATKTLMQNCSSGAGGYYFDASNVNHLSAAFASIANSRTELRLSK
ncbi:MULTISPECIES: TadE/TadG family type IV pilus assembly protein [unclassified Brenneria]|uniref:TadE/TadG family type IV pilus assembly protein n=1 Tax=unclassified Brenneria TaxID=2634434 RepID=UPI0015578407|nr:pilus assembly protein [Brenneria sp. hezel4-2-4]MEE3651083.1 pilus assembly protein [Brenneria sp. HEZEL_4_2_4]NPD01038.1 TadE/TadG family protein [Brenneria sp. hezel4-2-4]